MNELNDRNKLTEVLAEFHQRVQAEPKVATGVPPSFKIGTSVQTLHGTKFPTAEARKPNQVVSQGAKIRPETDFDFGQHTYFFPGNNGPFSFIIVMQLSCHNNGAVPISPLEIRTNGVWITYTTPAMQGPVSFAWDHHDYWPSKYGEQLTLAVSNCFLVNHPALTSSYLSISFALRGTAPPYDWAKTLYYNGERPELYTVHNELFPPLINGRWGSGVQIRVP
jgi:hypothetical protein